MPILRIVVVMTAAGLALAACGVRGDPEPPPGAEAVAGPAQRTSGVEVDAPPVIDPVLGDLEEHDDTYSDRVIESQRRTRYPPVSDSFILDPLL